MGVAADPVRGGDMSRSEEAVKGGLKGWFFPLGGQGICELGGRAAKERPLNFGLPQVCCKAVAPEVGGGCFAWGGGVVPSHPSAESAYGWGTLTCSPRSAHTQV